MQYNREAENTITCQMIFSKGANTIQWKMNGVFQQAHIHTEKNESACSPHVLHKNSTECTQDLT